MSNDSNALSWTCTRCGGKTVDRIYGCRVISCFNCKAPRPAHRDVGTAQDKPQPATTRPAKPSKASDGPKASKAYVAKLCEKWEREHRFAPPRRFRFDWALPSHRVAVEWEGIFAGKSRHTTLKGYSKDAEKYNAAAILGWIVLRFTALHTRAYVDETIRAAVTVGGETWYTG